MSVSIDTHQYGGCGPESEGTSPITCPILFVSSYRSGYSPMRVNDRTTEFCTSPGSSIYLAWGGSDIQAVEANCSGAPRRRPRRVEPLVMEAT